LAEDRFNLAVVGPFSRGKSSLMNAILGFDVLPTGILPHTSVITTVSYGPEELVLVCCEGWSLPQKIQLDQLAEYVTENGNLGNQRRVTLAEIKLPGDILRHVLYFIDTPGLGSAIIANTETTERFLPEIDAAIFVSSFDFALTRQLGVRVIDCVVMSLERRQRWAGFARRANRSLAQRSDALVKFDEAVSAFKARCTELVTRLRTHANDALGAVMPRLDVTFANLKQNARKKYQSVFLGGKIFSRFGALQAFTRNVSAFCEQALTRELRIYEPALNKHLEGNAGAILTQISALPDELFTINYDGDSGTTPKPAAEKPKNALPDLEIGGAALLSWSPLFPWWIHLAQHCWFSTAMKRQFAPRSISCSWTIGRASKPRFEAR
jgi:hypothetical protein